MDFGFESRDFNVELEDVEVKRIKRFERIWRFSYGGSIAYHVLHEGVAYFGSMDSFVYAVDVRTGKMLWRFKTSGSNYGSVSNVHKGLICVPSYDHNVYCLETKTGKEKWRFNTGDKVFGTPLIYGDVVYFGSKSGYFYKVNLNDGSLVWRFKTSGDISSAPALYGKNVMIGSFDGNWYCLDSETGNEIWRFKTGGEVVVDRPAKIYNDVLYVTSHDSYLYALDAETGKEIWRVRTGKFGNNTSPELLEDTLILGSRDGYLFAFTLEGKEKWRFRAGGQLIIGTSIHNGRIYFGAEDGNFFCLDKNGNEIWRFRMGEGGSYDYPTFFNGMIVVASMDCHLYALDENTGKEIWRFETSSRQPSRAPPTHEQFEVALKKETHTDDAISEGKYKKKKEESVSLSDYQVESEYSSESEYKQKSDYDVEWLIFEGAMEDMIWSNSEDLKPNPLVNLKQN